MDLFFPAMLVLGRSHKGSDVRLEFCKLIGLILIAVFKTYGLLMRLSDREHHLIGQTNNVGVASIVYVFVNHMV